MIKFFTNFNKKIRGFTLVETLVAISIFSISLVGLMSVLARGISDTGYAQNKDIAAYLAQEGIEYIHNLRDTYVLYTTPGGAQAGWTAFNNKLISNACSQPNGCYFNADDLFNFSPPMPMTQIVFSACSNPTCSNALIRYNSASGKYNYTTGVNSIYTRWIDVTIVNPNETLISSTVRWTQGSGPYSITFSESLFNWVE